MDLTKYLCDNEVTQLIQTFEISLQNDSALVFWTGISQDLAKNWARTNDLKTLTMAMGSLYADNTKKRKSESWSNYMKGASWMFAQQACRNRYAIVFTSAPPNVYSKREHSTYREIEEPILKGLKAEGHAIQIDYVHPTVPGAACFRYQIWPDNRSSEWFSFLERISVKDIVNKIIQCADLQRSKDRKKIESTKQSGSNISINLATSVAGGVNRKSGTAWKSASVERPKAEKKKQEAREKKIAKQFRVEKEKQEVQEKKAAAKQLKAKKKKQEAQEKAAAKRLESEKKAAKRAQAETEKQEARERKAAKQLKAEIEQQAAQERKASKRLKFEEEQRAAQEKKAAKQLKIKEKQQATREKKAAKRLKTKTLGEVVPISHAC